MGCAIQAIRTCLPVAVEQQKKQGERQKPLSFYSYHSMIIPGSLFCNNPFLRFFQKLNDGVYFRALWYLVANLQH